MRNPAFSVVDRFEKAVCEYTGAPYCVAVDSCTNAIFLSLRWWHEYLKNGGPAIRARDCFLHFPKHTYVGAVQSAVNARFVPNFQEVKWKGYYQIEGSFGSPVIDSARRFTSGMVEEFKQEFGTLYLVCLSFQAAKTLPIGRGGAILTGDRGASEWLRRARFDGRDEDAPISNESVTQEGWHMYMTPEQAARGLWLMQYLPEHNEDIGGWEDYPDLSGFEVFK